MHGPRALAAICAALVLVLGQFAALTHRASVRHVTCDLHGEEIDAPAVVGDHHGGSDVHGVAGQSGEHEHCVIARLLSSSIDRAHTVRVVDLVPVAIATRRCAATSIVSSVDLVLIAPKTSPPRPS